MYILGIEFGSTRIKSVLIDETGKVLASGSHGWQNRLINGYWSYTIEDIVGGMQDSYAKLVADFGKPITHLDGIGISAMMHGYLAFDKNWQLLESFRSWRNTTTEQAANILTDKLSFNFPQRWSATHYYQAVLNKEPTVSKVAHLQTLAGYVHYLLCGQNVLGADDASGMFPIDGKGYDKKLVAEYNKLVGCNIETLLPEVLLAGQNAGTLTDDGALLLDPTGKLRSGAKLCPPEGDMGTGMVATDSVQANTANISSGTAANMTVVLDKPLNKCYKQIDIIATPDGKPAALVHTNNCTTEINEWVSMFAEVVELCGVEVNTDKLFTALFEKSAESDGDVGGLVGYNYLAGEPLADTTHGAPMVVRMPEGKLNLANFMQMQIYSAIAAISLGMDMLNDEGVALRRVTAHGGFYKTENIGQIATSAVTNAPVTVMQNASEGGAWGIALLAAFMLEGGGNLDEYLRRIFDGVQSKTLVADQAEKAKCTKFLQRYRNFLTAEQIASRVK